MLRLSLGFLLICQLPLAAQTRAPLLAFSKGDLPTDTGSEATKTEVAESKELGGKVLKVDLHDSFGEKATRVPNWKKFSALAFQAYNPGEQPVALHFNVRHQKSTNYPTRVDTVFTLKPGKNDVRFVIADLRNTNDSVPDLANVVRWYIHHDQKKPITLYFSDIVLEGGSDAPTSPAAKVTGDPARIERIRKAKMPGITGPISFDTPEADAICSALEVFPENNPWNLVIEDWPTHSNSKNIVASIGADKPFRYNPDMGFMLVPPDQKRVGLLKIFYKDESDKGPYPIPDAIPIEGWPAHYQRSPKLKDLTLDDVQRDKLKEGGDRHALVVDPVNRVLYEFYQLKKVDGGWQAAQASIFDLKSNKLRPETWTSADAAGLPIFPAVVRYDELQRGMVEHAMRVTVVKTRRAYVYPATHYASKHTDVNLPRMGERLRLRKDFDVSGFSPEVQAILKGLKKYGMYVADNGIDWAISCAPDPRIPNMHAELRKLKGSDFEVVTAPDGYQPPRD